MIVGGSIGCGKTTELIKKASQENLYIVCASRQSQLAIEKMANSMELDIPFPITVDELPVSSPFIEKVLVDDVEGVLQRIIQKPVAMASTSLPMKKLQNPILGG
jgi:hypothetical protein